MTEQEQVPLVSPGQEGNAEELMKDAECSEEDEILQQETEETYSSGSEDDDDESFSSEDEGSWTETLTGAWRQHLVAVLVAVLATVVAMKYQQSTISLDAVDDTSSLLSSLSVWKHEHLNNYKRTANISFCGQLKPQVSQQLELFDFHVKKDHLDALKIHYKADALEDDDYSMVMDIDIDIEPTDPEYQCLKQLGDSTTKSFVKGITYHYQPPAFTSMFPNHEPSPGVKSKSVKPAHLTFTGFAAKFINLSTKPILLHWENREDANLVGEIAPLDSLGTATTPGQSFFVTPVYDSSHALARWVLTADEPIMVYEDETSVKKMTKKQKWLYKMHQLNLEFGQHYLIASKRVWLAQFPRRFPVHHMHHANFVGQEIPISLSDNDNQLQKLTVQSVTPRVFTIDNFLSAKECNALIQMAKDQGLVTSTLVTGSSSSSFESSTGRDLSTRSSKNTWIERNFSTDEIYKRAARLLQIDELLLGQHDHHDDATRHSIAESIQVVRYKRGEEYTAHHDFVYPASIHRYQPTRFATLLLYLNDGFKGGETTFPRAVNPTNHEGLTVTPKQGRAVLFYNMLPDGNVDDLSQHSSAPVIKGEKWLANLWVWDPVIN